MELWIRSQDKRKLCNCKSFSIRNIGDYAIFDDKDENIGQYRLEKRCLEILDEIQKIMSVEPLGLMVAHNCELDNGEEFYDEMKKQFKEDGFAMVYCPQFHDRQTDLQFIPKNIIVYEMPEK